MKRIGLFGMCRIFVITWAGSLLGLAILLLCLVLMTGCATSRTSWGSAGSCDAFKVTMADPQNGNVVPTIIAGGGAHVMLFVKPVPEGEAVPTAIAYSRRRSMWGLFAGDIDAGNVSFLYIAGSAETPEDTKAILQDVARIVNPVKQE